MGIFRQPLQRHGASCRVPQQALQLITPIRWHLGVGVQRKAVDTGTAGSRQCRGFPFIPKARANPSHLLPGPLANSNTLCDGGRQGVREGGLIVPERIIARGDGGGAVRLQVSQRAQRADDALADLLEDLGNVRIAGRLALDKARLEARCGAIEIDALKKDIMKMDMQIEGTTKALDKRHRPRLDLLPCDAALDRLIDVILRDCGANDRMDLCRQCL
jgi:hypothetical protein